MDKEMHAILDNYENREPSKDGKFIVAWNKYKNAIILEVDTKKIIDLPNNEYISWKWAPNNADLLARGDHVLDIIDSKTVKFIRTVQGYF